MCGRYTMHHAADDLAKRYEVVVPEDLRENYNVAPGQIMPVVTAGPRLELMKWGLVPFWAKDPKIGYKLINARDDTIFEKPTWRTVILRRRCLIPADGFYEWQRTGSGAKAHKQPFYIHAKGMEIFSFAGLWDSWKDAAGTEHHTYSIITTEPNKEMADIHNRMPVILYPEEEAIWINPDLTNRADIEPLLHPFTDGGLELYKVSDEVNSPKHNDKHLIYALD